MGRVGGPGLAVAAGHRLDRQRHERTQHDLLVAGRDEPRVDELDLVDGAAGELLDHVAGDALGVLAAVGVSENPVNDSPIW